MKRKLLLVLCGLLFLTACEKEVVTDITEEEISVLTEARGGAAVTTAENITAVSENVTAELPENISVIETERYNKCDIFGDYICCHFSDNSTLGFYNIESGILSGKVAFPEDSFVTIIKEGEGNALFNAVVETKTEDGYSYNRVNIYEDFSFENTGEASASDYAVKACGKNIVTLDGDLVDGDTMDILVEGIKTGKDNYGKGDKYQSFAFKIDDNRFVYRTRGYESIPGFGFYDFSTGVAKFIENSQDFWPLGYYNGKIYAVKTVWDGFGTELYTFDLKNPVPELFMENPIEISSNEFVEFEISEDGKYLVIVKPMNLYLLNENKEEDNNIGKGMLCTSDIETGEIIETIEVPDEYDMGQAIGFSGDKLLLGTGKNTGIIVVDLK